MYQRIIVPLDTSRFSTHAIRYAVAIADRTQGTIELVRVHIPEPTVADAEGLYQFTPYQFEGVANLERALEHEQTRQDALDLAERAQALAGQTGHTVTSRLLHGRIATALEEEAESFHADIFVMASHTRSGLDRIRFGSVGDALVRQATVPVLLVHPDQDVDPTMSPPAFRRVLAPLDGSPFSDQILVPAVDLARAFGAELWLLHVEPPPSDAEPDRDGRLAGVQALEAAARRCAAEFDPPHLEVVTGEHPASGILAAAQRVGADAIAMATHGRSGLSRWIAGSTADEVLRRTRMPVLLHRPAPHEAPIRGRSAIATYGHPHA